MTVKVQVEAFWVLTTCSVVVGYQCFRGPCCLHLQAWTCEMFVFYHDIIQHQNPEDFDLNYTVVMKFHS
jgi:hypothetical protein